MLTVAEDSELVRQVSVVVVSLYCLVDVEHCTVPSVQCDLWTTHCYSTPHLTDAVFTIQQ